MAIFHFSAQVITRSKGGNVVDAAAYRAGMRFTCERTGLVFNHTRKTEVAYRTILLPEAAAAASPSGTTDTQQQHLHAWALDREKLWGRLEATEKRRNSQLAREIQLAVPIGLSQNEQISLLHRYAKEQFTSIGMLADIALHDKPGNPHAHILLTLRELTPTGFGAKRRDWNNPALVKKWREAWATACNEALAAAGRDERIDHRSHKERGIEAPPTVHLGRRTPLNAESWDARADFNAWIQTSIALAKVRAEVGRVNTQLIDLTTSITEALAEREQRKAAAVVPTTGTVPDIPLAVQETPAPWTAPEDIRLGGLSLKERIRQSLARPGTSNRTGHFAGRHAPINPPHGAMHDPWGISEGDKPC